jgi:hypothetical protein
MRAFRCDNSDSYFDDSALSMKSQFRLRRANTRVQNESPLIGPISRLSLERGWQNADAGLFLFDEH